MAENIENATRPQLQELVQLLVERVQAEDRSVDPDSIEWTPPARPFFGDGALLWRPRTGAGRYPPNRRTAGGLRLVVVHSSPCCAGRVRQWLGAVQAATAGPRVAASRYATLSRGRPSAPLSSVGIAMNDRFGLIVASMSQAAEVARSVSPGLGVDEQDRPAGRAAGHRDCAGARCCRSSCRSPRR